MKIKHMMMTMAAPLAVAASPADAAVFSFNLTGAYEAAFEIDSDALANVEDFGDYFDVEANGTIEGRTGRQIVSFNTESFDGGLTLGDSLTNLWGPMLFTGSTAAPVLLTGTFSLTVDGDPSRVVNLNVAAVPEPATWAMMIAGFGLAGAALRRRQGGLAIA